MSANALDCNLANQLLSASTNNKNETGIKMKNSALTFLAALAIGLQVQANTLQATTFSCETKSGKTHFRGTIKADAMVVSISDETDELMIKDFKSPQLNLEVPKYNRKKEANYKFAKYYVDFNAWQDLEFSIPKDIIAGERKGKFASYFTVYIDNGDMMAPSESLPLNCFAK
jgi:hypothetical protein